jgi:HPt (histidine-containing phosphotransfer) domain-containing protein
VSASGLANIPDRLVSDLLRDDPETRDLVEEFVEGLTGRVAQLRQAYERLDWGTLTTLAHQLKGAGGSYGYSDLSRLCATMEAAFRTHSADQFATWMSQLEQLIAAARAGLPDR